ncbi:MAG TPA: O-antigen ligase family protein [Myxococcales bacterium]|nr:O-antigen ligase family protein [Myxococcales bacterium]
MDHVREQGDGGGGAVDSLAFGALTAFCAVTYVAPGEWLAELAPLRLALVTSTAALVLVAVARFGRRQGLLLDGWRGGALILFSALTLASSAWSIFPAGTRVLGVECLKYVGIYLTVVNLARTPRRLAILCGALVLASMVTSVGALRWYFAGQGLVEGYRARWVGLYADPNRMAMTLGLVVPLGLAFASRKAMAWPMRALSMASVALAVAAIVVSYSRGGFAGLAVAAGFWVVRERRFDRTLVVALAAATLLVMAPSSYWSRAGSVSGFREDASAMGRVHAWTVASRINADRPLLGTGAGTFRLAWPRYAPPEARRAYEAHNVFLQVLAELGWVGLLLFLGFIGAGMEGAWRASRDDAVGWLARALAASAAGYLVCSVSAGFLGGSAHFYALFGLAAAAHRLARAPAEPAVARGSAPGLEEKAPLALGAGAAR